MKYSKSRLYVHLCVCVLHTTNRSVWTEKYIFSIYPCEKCFQLPTFLCWIPPRMHQGHQYRMTHPAKTDASILVGGCESSAGRRDMCPYDEVTNIATVVDSHSPDSTDGALCGRVPAGTTGSSSSSRTSFAGASEIGTWNWNRRANLWTSDASWPSAFARFVWLKDVSRALYVCGGHRLSLVRAGCWWGCKETVHVSFSSFSASQPLMAKTEAVSTCESDFSFSDF